MSDSKTHSATDAKGDEYLTAGNLEAFTERAVRQWRSDRLACPSGCGCIFPDDPDQFECACDGLCVREAWNDLRQSLEEAHDG